MSNWVVLVEFVDAMCFVAEAFSGLVGFGLSKLSGLQLRHGVCLPMNFRDVFCFYTGNLLTHAVSYLRLVLSVMFSRGDRSGGLFVFLKWETDSESASH